MKISIGSDHGGLQLKSALKQYLLECGHDVADCGTLTADSCDYPDYAYTAAQKVADGECEKGILVCTTGIGMSIAANKIAGIRCALCTNADMAEMTRRHNDANMLALGAKYTDKNMAESIVDVFLNTAFEGGRHKERINKVDKIERGEKL